MGQVWTRAEIALAGVSVWVGDENITAHVIELRLETRWTDAQNLRRIALIGQKVNGRISDAERTELDVLTAELRAAQRAAMDPRHVITPPPTGATAGEAEGSDGG